MQDPIDQSPGASGRAWEARMRAGRQRRRGAESEPSAFERSIAKGAAGEEILGRELTALAQEMNLAVLHDLALPPSQANIDHLVIGPAGVTVVDAKNWDGAVWIGPKTMWLGRHSKYRSLMGVHDQVARVRQALDAGGCADVPVSGLLCMVNANKGVPVGSLKWSAGVGVGAIPSVRRQVAREGGLDLSRIRRVHDVLSERFAVSGGGYQPSLAAPPAPAGQPDLIDRLIAEVNRDALRSRVRRRRWALAAVTSLVLAIAGALHQPADRSAPGPLSRAELNAMRAELRAVAEERAQGRVRGPRVARSRTRFELLYRRGPRCRVRISVARSDRAVAVRSAGCGSRR